VRRCHVMRHIGPAAVDRHRRTRDNRSILSPALESAQRRNRIYVL
jgi:hypothetical protein